MLEMLRNLAAFGRDVYDAIVVHTCGPAIDTATASPLAGHDTPTLDVELHLIPANTLTSSTR